VTKAQKSNKAYIVSGILVILILFVALIGWMQDNNTVPTTNVQKKVGNNFEIAVYYFPERENDAKALTFYFNEHGYSVTMLPASNIEELEASRTSPSYIYFNQAQFKQAMGIKQKIEKVIGYPVNAYRYQNAQTSPAMMMVFTEEDR
jgi:hypothetical protein